MARKAKKLTKKDLAELIGYAPDGDEGRLMHLDLVGAAEAAEEILHVERARIGKWRRNGILLKSGDRIAFPEPITVVTTLAKQKKCSSCSTLYPLDSKACPSCGSKTASETKDNSKLAATPLWWGDDIRDLASALEKSRPK